MDCLEGLRQLPDKCVDIIVTSPPYNKGETANSGTIAKAVVYDSSSDDLDEDEYQKMQLLVLAELFRVLKDDGHLFYNHKNRYIGGRQISPLEWLLKSQFNIRQEIVWNRTIASNIRGWRFWQTDERIYWMQKPEAVRTELDSKVASWCSVWNILPDQNRKTGHPCAFPIQLVDKCLYAVGKEGDVVLDPYMGSGTTAMSAIKNNCHYIGFELLKNYVELSEMRIKDALATPQFL